LKAGPVGLQWFQHKDPVSAILERSLVNEPGTTFTYSGGNMIILGEIIRHATKMSFDDFSREYLFELLGIDTTEWVSRFNNGVIYTGGGLRITPRDMVKFGVTFLNGGIWEEKQIIPRHWVEKSALLIQTPKELTFLKNHLGDLVTLIHGGQKHIQNRVRKYICMLHLVGVDNVYRQQRLDCQ